MTNNFFGMNKKMYIVTGEMDMDTGYTTGTLTKSPFYGRAVKSIKRIINKNKQEIQTSYNIYTVEPNITVNTSISFSLTGDIYKVVFVDEKTTLDDNVMLYIVTV
jgi:hypothetical protein